MARKLTRYKVNRQFRKNPTRSRVFFPYRLPFQADFRLMTQTGTEVSAATASRWRAVVKDISEKGKEGKLLPRGTKRAAELAAGPVVSTALSKVLKKSAKTLRTTGQGLIKREIIPEYLESVAFFLSPLI